MLKSTHNKSGVSTAEDPSALPPGWTEHKAPTGHAYYYHAESKQSTYKRPVVQPSTTATQNQEVFPDPHLLAENNVLSEPYQGGGLHGEAFQGRPSFHDRAGRRQPEDRPKKKKAIPGCEPWFLVTTKLGRRFVYNAEKNESFWKFPQDVLLATIEMDRKAEQQNRVTTEVAPKVPDAKTSSQGGFGGVPGSEPAVGDDDDSYEEVEVTDDENDAAGEDQGPSKKARTDSAAKDAPPGPVEFNEDDIAYQLAQMGDDYGLEPEEYGDGEEGEHDGGIPLSFEDSKSLFFDLLSDYNIDPYGTWDQTVEGGHIIDDARYVALPTMRARKEAFSEWTTEQIQVLKIKRAQERKKDPRIPYVEFLHRYASPKLYWPEFKRKYRKEEAMRDSSLSDKEREKLYRELINLLKKPESTRKSDFNTLLKSTPLDQLNRRSTLASLPSAVLTDLRFISLSLEKRDSLLEAYMSTLPLPDPVAEAGAQETEESKAKAADRERREKALKEREKKVQEEKKGGDG